MPLEVSSEAGTEAGDTKLTVSPAKGPGNVYKIKIADEAQTVTLDQNVQNWTAWDGEADVTAATGKVITVVEATSDYRAKKSGYATVVAKD